MHRGKPRILAGIAALAVGAIVVLVVRDDGSPVADAVDSATATSAPVSTSTVPTSTTEATSSTAAPEADIDPWEDTAILLFAGPAGEYRTSARFFAPFRVTLPEGWTRAFPELSDIVEVSPSPEACEADQAADDCLGLITIYDPLVPDLDEAVAVLRNTPNITASEPEPIEMAGVTGFRLVVTTDELAATLHTIRDGGRIFIGPNRRFVTHVLDVVGQPVVLILDTPTDGSFETDALPVVESIVWRALE